MELCYTWMYRVCETLCAFINKVVASCICVLRCNWCCTIQFNLNNRIIYIQYYNSERVQTVGSMVHAICYKCTYIRSEEGSTKWNSLMLYEYWWSSSSMSNYNGQNFFPLFSYINIFIIAIDDAFGLIKLLWTLIYSNSKNNAERNKTEQVGYNIVVYMKAYLLLYTICNILLLFTWLLKRVDYFFV